MRDKEIVRKRVAAYCRVSTDGEEQLNSFSSQVKYYTELIEKEPDWMMAGVYADEAITGTQVSKREGFQKMIKACLDGEVDMVITKSISRFARNTLDTLKYVRTLKEKNIAVFFEDEKINTLSMDGELLLVVLSSVAQQEVENISNNVKKGLAMKMSRGEIVGFVGALGYDYDPVTKTMTVNQERAKIVQYIFNRYVSGVGTSTIARELEEMGVPNPSGSKTWHQTTVAGIIRNEKYVGDLLQGKTFTVDPISHRRLDNLGESDKYLMKDHHEAIVSREVFDKAQEILAKRGKCHSNARLRKDEYRTLYTNKYAFSCKCRCGYWTLSDSELEKNVYIQKYDDESFKEMHKSYCLDAKITEDNFNKSKKIAKFLEEHPEYKDKSINEICLEAGGQNLLFQIVCLQHSLQNKDMRKEVIINKHENIYPELFPLDE